MLINLSNHPSAKWSEKQTETAVKHYSSVIDIEFPSIDPKGDENYIQTLTMKYADICTKQLETSKDKNNAVHIMGEFNFSFSIVSELLKRDIKCLASTTERFSVDNPDGSKTINFSFVKFREYIS